MSQRDAEVLLLAGEAEGAGLHEEHGLQAHQAGRPN